MLNANPNAHNKAQINHLLLKKLRPYWERIIWILTNSLAAINRNTALLAISKSTSCHLRNRIKVPIVTELESRIIFNIILPSINHWVALRGLRFITFGLIGSTHNAIAGNQSVITFNHSKWIANKGIGTQIKLAINRIAISHIFETII